MLIIYPNGLQIYKHTRDKRFKLTNKDGEVLALVLPEKLLEFLKLSNLKCPEELKKYLCLKN